MIKGVAVLLVVLFIIGLPAAYPLSLKELILKYIFSSSSPQMDVTSFSDYMADKDNDGLNDTLILELTTDNAAGNFIFAASIFDKNGIITNETNITLNSGANKLNLSFDTILLSQDQFNYSIKVYNSTNSLKFRKDNSLTQIYSGYEEGFNIMEFSDYSEDKKIKISALINSTLNGTFESALFLRYNNSFISSKTNFTINGSVSNLTFIFGNETIKRTHYSGTFNVSSVKIGKKAVKSNFTSNSYDFRNFAASSYISDFEDAGIDTDNDGKFDELRLRIKINAFQDGEYTLNPYIYDLFNEVVEIKNETRQLVSGTNNFDIMANGSNIYSKKINGPFEVKTIGLYKDGALEDYMDGAYITANYNFDDFDAPSLPDLEIEINDSGEYHYGINNVTISIAVKNSGQKHAFNVFNEIFDNGTFFKSNKTGILLRGSNSTYELRFSNFTDFEITAFADPNDLVDEKNESNNARSAIIRLNKNPVLSPVANITVNETSNIMINLSAFDANGDAMGYSINSTKFAGDSNVFYWNTTTKDSGNYSLKATVSDGYLNDSALFIIEVSDMPEIDSDNDGINDSLDMIAGDSINSTTLNATIYVDDSSDLARVFNSTSRLKILDGNRPVMEFDFDFFNYKLNLTNVSVEKQTGNFTGSLIIRGLNLPAGTTKTAYVDNLSAGINGICIRDEKLLSISEISGSCTSNNEYPVECDGTLQNSYSCSYNATLNKYKITGLKHSGIIQFSYSKPSQSNPQSSGNSGGSSGSSGGGGGVVCISDWQCSEWSDCNNEFKTRICSDKSQCAFLINKPNEKEDCKANAEIYNGSNDGISKKEDADNSSFSNAIGAFSSITGKAVDEVTSSNSYSLIFVLVGLIILIAGYFTIRKYKME